MVQLYAEVTLAVSHVPCDLLMLSDHFVSVHYHAQFSPFSYYSSL